MTQIRNFVSTLAAATLLAAPGFAGNLADPVVQAAPPPPPPAIYTGGEWTGFYGGLQLGYGDVDTSVGADGDGDIYGVHLGYNHDFGTFVLGGEIDYDKMDIGLTGGATVDEVARIKVRAGYDMGSTLLYATLGAARADTSLGNETGVVYGLGLSYQITDRFLLGGEVLRHDFNDIDGSGVDADVNTFTIRATFRF